MYLPNKHQIIINDVFDEVFNFERLLENKNSLLFKNCANLNIRIDSKINKIIFIRCKNINIFCCHTISGIEFEKCENIVLLPSTPYELKVIDCYKSNIDIYVDDLDIYHRDKDKIKITSDKSYIKIYQILTESD